MREYWLHDDVYCTHVGDSYVLLDLKTGRYLGLRNDDGAALQTVVNDWPAVESAVNHSSPDLARKLSAALYDRGLLANSPPAGRVAGNPPVTATRSIGLADVYSSGAGTTSSVVRRFFTAYTAVRWRMSVYSMRRLLEYVGHLTARCRLAAKPPEFTERELLRDFYKLRSLTYTAYERCLLDSLVLAVFLSNNNVRCSFVLGVTTIPFGAHCWVQMDDILLNESIERAASYTPMLSV